MQSVALTDLSSNDEECVLVEAAEEADDDGMLLLLPSAPGAVDAATVDDDDDASRDHCDDVFSLPSTVHLVPSIVHSMESHAVKRCFSSTRAFSDIFSSQEESIQFPGSVQPLN